MSKSKPVTNEQEYKLIEMFKKLTIREQEEYLNRLKAIVIKRKGSCNIV